MLSESQFLLLEPSTETTFERLGTLDLTYPYVWSRTKSKLMPYEKCFRTDLPTVEWEELLETGRKAFPPWKACFCHTKTTDADCSGERCGWMVGPLGYRCRLDEFDHALENAESRIFFLK